MTLVWDTAIRSASAPPRQAAPPGEADEHLAGQEPAVVVPPDQPVGLEREQQPRGGRLGQPGGRAQPGERHRAGRVHDLREQPSRPVQGLGLRA